MYALFWIFDLGEEFHLKKLSTLLIGSFFIEITFVKQMSIFFKKLKIIIGSVEAKKNIFRLSWSQCFGALQYLSTGLIHQK